jgi:rRNA processing protein Gar1
METNADSLIQIFVRLMSISSPVYDTEKKKIGKY